MSGWFRRPGRSRIWLVVVLTIVAMPAAAESDVITFLGYRGGQWQLFAVVGGGAVRPLGPRAGDITGGAIAPARDRALVVVDQTRLLVVGITGGETQTIDLAEGAYGHPVWLDPNTAVLTHYDFRADSENADLVSVDLLSGRVTALLAHTGNADFADVSADRRRLAYTLGETVGLRRAAVHVYQRLWTVDLGTGKPSPIASAHSPAIHPRWSPDGSTLAFAGGAPENPGIWTVREGETSPVPVVSDVDAAGWPAWSPDGTTLLFTRTIDGSQSLWTVPAGGGALQLWAPSGAKDIVEMRDAHWR